MSKDAPLAKTGDLEFDPVFLNARREAIVIFLIWLAGLLWCVPCCYLLGFKENYNPETMKTILGVPSWLFWGIALPWVVADVLTVFVAFFYMRDEHLDVVEGEQE
ncbi:MAG: DUF997 family protein [Planctomycetales bacterium]|nr:DUF997 family protein [Planctomycetales bacterium]